MINFRNGYIEECFGRNICENDEYLEMRNLLNCAFNGIDLKKFYNQFGKCNTNFTIYPNEKSFFPVVFYFEEFVNANSEKEFYFNVMNKNSSSAFVILATPSNGNLWFSGIINNSKITAFAFDDVSSVAKISSKPATENQKERMSKLYADETKCFPYKIMTRRKKAQEKMLQAKQKILAQKRLEIQDEDKQTF